MFWENWFKKETVSEPVLTLVEKVKANPKAYDLRLIGKDHLVLYFDKSADWQFSVSVQRYGIHTNDQAAWMNKAEKLYVFNELIKYAKGDQYSRQGWMQKVTGEQ
ncbi:hypothetical protein EspYZU15_99 [Cronobacter phage EspYZU15]|nr:hypothetical protein EspYZU15_99 [Cronobacter phage EspYZU15]